MGTASGFRSVCCAIAAFAVLSAACSKPKPVVAPEVGPGTARRGAAPPAATPGATEVRSEPRVVAAHAPEAGVRAGELPTDLAELNRAGYLRDGYFDTNRAELRDDTREALAANANWLKAHPGVKILIEGHCDERNTAEYNLALGWRRANAAKDYLVLLGVDGSRVSTISYGEERPFALGHDEGAWWQNRCAHFVITAR